MKMTNGEVTIECIQLTRNIWLRNGFVDVVEEIEEVVEVEEEIEEAEEEFEEVEDLVSSDELEELSWQELKTLAKERNISSYKMNKEELLEALK